MNARTVEASPKPSHDDERAALVESARKVIRIEQGPLRTSRHGSTAISARPAG